MGRARGRGRYNLLARAINNKPFQCRDGRDSLQRCCTAGRVERGPGICSNFTLAHARSSQTFPKKKKKKDIHVQSRLRYACAATRRFIKFYIIEISSRSLMAASRPGITDMMPVKRSCRGLRLFLPWRQEHRLSR